MPITPAHTAEVFKKQQTERNRLIEELCAFIDNTLISTYPGKGPIVVNLPQPVADDVLEEVAELYREKKWHVRVVNRHPLLVRLGMKLRYGQVPPFNAKLEMIALAHLRYD